MEHLNKQPQSADLPNSQVNILFDLDESSELLLSLQDPRHHLMLFADCEKAKGPAKTIDFGHDNMHMEFKNIFDMAHLFYTVFDQGVAQDLRLDKKEQTCFTFYAITENLCPIRQEELRRIAFVDAKNGEPLYYLTDPAATDMCNAFAHVQCRVEWTYRQFIRFTYQISPEWLKRPKCFGPVVLRSQLTLATSTAKTHTPFEDFSFGECDLLSGIHHYPDPACSGDVLPNMKIGRGWNMNVVQSMTPFIQGALSRSFVYRDGQGKRTVLLETDIPISLADVLNARLDNRCQMGACGECWSCGLDPDDCDCMQPYKYMFQSADGKLLYNPRSGVLQKDDKLYVFGADYLLEQIIDKEDRYVSIINIGRKITSIVIQSKQIYRFYYDNDYLVAIIGPHNERVEYRYQNDCLMEVIYPDGQKFICPDEDTDTDIEPLP